MKTVKIVTVLLVLFSLTACEMANYFRLRHANDQNHPIWTADTSAVVLQTQYIGEKPHVRVSVNGQPDFLFLIDTGASLSILLNTPKVRALSLPQLYSLPLQGIGQQSKSQAFGTRVESLSLGGIQFQNFAMAYMPVSMTDYYLREDEALFDGILGHDVLRNYAWQFDKRGERVMVFNNNGDIPTNASTVTIDGEVALKRFFIQGSFHVSDNHVIEHELLVDTGSRSDMKVSSAYFVNRDIDISQPTVRAADFGLSGRHDHQRVTFPQLSLGDLALNDIKVNLMPTDDEDDFWLIGSALISNFVTVVDYPRQQMHFTPYASFPFRSRYNLVGLELRKIHSGNFVVRNVLPDMAAAQFDFDIGDEVVSINNVPAQEISLDDWLDISNGEGAVTVCRKRETTECMGMEKQHIRGYSD